MPTYLSFLIGGWSDINKAIKDFEKRHGCLPKYLISDSAFLDGYDEYQGVKVIFQYVGYRTMFLGDDRLPTNCWTGNSYQIAMGMGRR